MNYLSQKLKLAVLYIVLIVIGGCTAYPYDNSVYHAPPGLVKHGKIPPGLAKQGKIPPGWYKNKSHNDELFL